MRNIRKATGHEERPTTKFGQHVTAHHNIHSGGWKLPSVGGRTAALNVLDRHTTFRGNYPLLACLSTKPRIAELHLEGTMKAYCYTQTTRISSGPPPSSSTIPGSMLNRECRKRTPSANKGHVVMSYRVRGRSYARRAAHIAYGTSRAHAARSWRTSPCLGPMAHPLGAAARARIGRPVSSHSVVRCTTSRMSPKHRARRGVRVRVLGAVVYSWVTNWVPALHGQACTKCSALKTLLANHCTLANRITSSQLVSPHLANRVTLFTEDGIAFPLNERYDGDSGGLE